MRFNKTHVGAVRVEEMLCVVLQALALDYRTYSRKCLFEACQVGASGVMQPMPVSYTGLCGILGSSTLSETFSKLTVASIRSMTSMTPLSEELRLM